MKFRANFWLIFEPISVNFLVIFLAIFKWFWTPIFDQFFLVTFSQFLTVSVHHSKPISHHPIWQLPANIGLIWIGSNLTIFRPIIDLVTSPKTSNFVHFWIGDFTDSTNLTSQLPIAFWFIWLLLVLLLSTRYDLN